MCVLLVSSYFGSIFQVLHNLLGLVFWACGLMGECFYLDSVWLCLDLLLWLGLFLGIISIL